MRHLLIALLNILSTKFSWTNFTSNLAESMPINIMIFKRYKKPMLLSLDESQTLLTGNKPSEDQIGPAIHPKCYSQWFIGRPVVFIAASLHGMK